MKVQCLTPIFWYFTLFGLLNCALCQHKLEFKDYTEEDFKKLLTWKPPEDISKDYPYFLSGYDEDGAPIWVAEQGKWDPRKSVEAGPERTRSLQIYEIQMLARFIQSSQWNSTAERQRNEFNLILDMDGYSAKQISSPATLELQLWGARQYSNAFVSLKQATVVNGNFVFTTIWELMKPILGPLAYKVNIFGSNKNQWVPYLRKQYPIDQLPEWLGGSEKHVPVSVYG